MLDLFSIGRSDDQRQHYTKIHIALNEARQLDVEHQQPKLRRARTDYARPIGVKAGKFSRVNLVDMPLPSCRQIRTFSSMSIGVMLINPVLSPVLELERIQDGGASNPTVRYSQS